METLETRQIGKRYARALFDAAEDQGQLLLVAESVRNLHQLYEQVPDLQTFFANPLIPSNEKKAVIEQKLTPGMIPVLTNLLNLILQNDRLFVLPEILESFLDIFDRKAGIAHADVTVPVPITMDVAERMRDQLRIVFGYQQVNLNVNLDPTILAGAVVRIGDKIIDGSYKGKLDLLRKQVG